MEDSINSIESNRIKIIKANTEHYDEISFLGKKTFDETFGYLFKPEVLDRYLQATFNSEKIKLSLSKENNHFFTVYLDNNPIGYAKIKENSFYDRIDDQNQLQLQKIYILSQYHGLGIGLEFMKTCKKFFERFSPATVWLAVLESNIKAINYYEKCGFRKTGKYHYSFEDANFIYDVMKLKV
ncbi:GNAT family N-acetyltransferase [uncultured Clostridium sp.]|uniref:GNAT family N-acetyltransferase n=1 Tax=uncultured Clostridium sp. TaxID=59620 RepID=UPI00258AD78D|nr:GNAT family N-acetyltransferase [uncultured Clostridium sp.]MDU1350365.1 GNAT family N-acetyltransferase [Clostridium argentinense]